MKFLMVLAVIVTAIAVVSTATAGTSLSGGLAGAFVFDENRTATALAPGLGATYRPDKVVIPTGDATFTPAGFAVEPSDFVFWTNQWFRDGQADLNATGMGYSVFERPNFEILAEGGVVFKGLGDETFRVGGLGVLDFKFVALSQNMAFKIGFGSDGDQPMGILGLSFETE